MSLRSAALAVAGFALACSKSDTRRSASAEQAGTTSSPASKAIALANPAQAAAQFVNARVRGEGLTTNACLGRDTIRCGSAAVVDSVVVDSTARVRGDTARVVARYVEIGSLTQGPGALRYLPTRDASARVRNDTLVLARDGGGWRVVRLDQRTRVRASLAMYYFDLADHGRDSIASDASLSWSSVVRPVLTEPARLTQVPEPIRDTLKTRGCRVLQTRGQLSDNALRGALFGTGGEDWVFLCATRSADAVILVFPGVGGTPTDLPNVGGSLPDVDALPEPDNAGRIYGCAPRTGLVPADMMKLLVHTGRLVTAAGADTLSASERRLPVHDGIVSSDCEGVSNVHYWTGRRWVQFAGAD